MNPPIRNNGLITHTNRARQLITCSNTSPRALEIKVVELALDKASMVKGDTMDQRNMC